MKHVVIDKCLCGRDWCSGLTNNFIFYHRFTFYLVTSNYCMGFKDLDSKEKIIHSCIDNVSKKDIYEATWKNHGRADLGKSFKENRLRGLSLERWVDEVNFVYRPIGRSDKCLSTRFKYIDFALGQDELTKDYEETKKYLEERGFESLVPFLEELYQKNRIYEWNDFKKEAVKAVDNLIKTIRDDIKSKSEHQSFV